MASSIICHYAHPEAICRKKAVQGCISTGKRATHLQHGVGGQRAAAKDVQRPVDDYVRHLVW